MFGTSIAVSSVLLWLMSADIFNPVEGNKPVSSPKVGVLKSETCRNMTLSP